MNNKFKKIPKKLLMLIILIETVFLIVIILIINWIIPIQRNSLDQFSNPINNIQGSSSGHLPNLFYFDLIDQLKANNYVCSERAFENNLYSWQCQKSMQNINYEILIFSRNESEIDLIDANIEQSFEPDDEIAIEFLCQVASIPFDLIPQEESCSWINSTIPQINEVGELHERSYHGIRHILYGTNEARSLELGQLP